jgi:hypothetical protein
MSPDKGTGSISVPPPRKGVEKSGGNTGRRELTGTHGIVVHI